VQVERVKSSRKVLYDFAIFAIINEILIKKISANSREFKRAARRDSPLVAKRATKFWEERFVNNNDMSGAER
jgi:hypothetical protein